MSRNAERKGLMGPGGINCSCCRPGSNKRHSKTLSNRYIRLKGKAAIAAGMKEIE